MLQVMLFDELRTEKDLEALKRRILRDDVLYARFCSVRDSLYKKDQKGDNTIKLVEIVVMAVHSHKPIA